MIARKEISKETAGKLEIEITAEKIVGHNKALVDLNKIDHRKIVGHNKALVDLSKIGRHKIEDRNKDLVVLNKIGRHKIEDRNKALEDLSKTGHQKILPKDHLQRQKMINIKNAPTHRGVFVFNKLTADISIIDPFRFLQNPSVA
jgi:phosphopantothenoylcysteine synthetase/decarboxylase